MNKYLIKDIDVDINLECDDEIKMLRDIWDKLRNRRLSRNKKQGLCSYFFILKKF